MTGRRDSKPEEKEAEPEDLWHRVVRHAKPQSNRHARITHVETPEGPAEPVRPTAKSESPPPPLSRPPEAYKPLSHGDVSTMDKRSGQRFRRGQVAIEARLDLHGMTRDRAYEALSRFIERNWDHQYRCVIVITGKGLTSEGGVGVLRSAVPEWLNGPGLRERILSFTHAQPKDGGQGALYVMLKRRREGA